MANSKITLAIFDFDGTLTEGHLWLGIARHHQQKRVKRRTFLLYFLTHMPFWLATKFKLYSDEKNKARWGEDLSTLFKGFTVDEGHRAFEWVTDNYFMPLMRADLLDKLKSHQKQGQKIMLLSGMFTDFLMVIGKRLGVDYVVGTRLEVVNDAYSGRIIKPLCFAKEKAYLLNEFIRKQGLEVDFSQSTAYADSIYDSPVFEIVGHPVATYPEKELLKYAQSRNWEVIGNTNHSAPNHR
jgi:HAD superfamily hydrolase (TIGR01490 family)